MGELKRSLGLFDTVSLSLGAIIGAGIFAVTGVASQISGPSLLFSVMIAGIIAALTGVSASQLVKAFPVEGGEYEFAYRTLSPFFAFLSGWMWCLNKIVSDSVIALGFANYVSLFLPLQIKIIAIIAVAAAAAINYFGISATGRAMNLLTITKVSILLFFVFAGIFNIKTSNYFPFFPNGVSGMLEASAIIFFAYVGFIRPIYVVEEIRDPEKNIPKGIFLGLAISALIYFLVMFVAIGLVGSSMLGSTDSPIALAMNAINLPFGVPLIIFGAIVATFSVLLGDVLGLSRMVFAMGRRGDLPKWFGHVEKRSGTPRNAVLLSGLAIAVPLLFFDLRGLVQVASFLILVYFSLLNFSATRLGNSPRKISIISIMGILSTLTLAFSLSLLSISVGFLLISSGIIYFLVKKLLLQTKT
jgi:APA family basic amino acid/polyamine antiporter